MKLLFQFLPLLEMQIIQSTLLLIKAAGIWLSTEVTPHIIALYVLRLLDKLVGIILDLIKRRNL